MVYGQARRPLRRSRAMPFELSLRYETPLTALDDPEEVLRGFLRWIGYLPEGDDARSGEGGIESAVGYRLFHDCLLGQPEHAWYVEELVAHLHTSRPTVYRHLNKLKSLDLLEEVVAPSDGKGRKAYRLRYADLARAWDFAEAHARNALRLYRDTVDHLAKLLEDRRRSGAGGGE